MAIEIFISYAHEDHSFLKELEKHLANLKRQDIISSWYDGDITPGAEWESEIMERLTSAQMILLLISADFFQSDFCSSIEMKQAINRHNAGEACVIPVLLRPTDWQGAPFDKLKMLPTDAKAVTSWSSHDDAFADVVRGIRAAIDTQISTGKTATPSIASGTMQMSIWNVPYQRNLLFTGRQDVLKRLSDAFKVGKTAAQPHAISGLGGIGKTQTAVEYAYRYRDDYRVVLWVKAETEGSINSDFVTLAHLLNLAEKQEQDQHKIVEAVKRWLQEHTDWLLILDNADDLAMVQSYLPLGSKGHILLTTRAHATGRIAQRIEVEKMEPDEGALFLLHRSTLLDLNALLEVVQVSDRTIAREIVKAMDGLPLALEQAGAYIEETVCGLQGYVRLYRAQGVQLLKEHSEFVPDHPEPVATTWSLSFKKVEQANAAAAELLRFCAFLAPDAIPEELFAESAVDLGPRLEPVASDLSRLNAAIRELLKYSLVQRDPETQTLSIHRLVQEVLKDRMNEEVQREWAERAVRAVNRAFPAVEFESWDRCRRMLTHAQACVDLISQWNMKLPEAANLLYKTGSFLDAHGQYVETEPFLQGALVIGEQSLGPDHPDVAIYLNDLAYLYMRNLGKKAEAEPLIQRALAINEQTFGADHPNTATTLHSLADLHWGQGKEDEAESLFQRVLAIREQKSGSDHHLTASILTNLADLYSVQGKYAEAEPLYQRALAIKEQTLFPDHPSIEHTLAKYATLLQQMQRNEEATQLEERVREIRARRTS